MSLPPLPRNPDKDQQLQDRLKVFGLGGGALLALLVVGGLFLSRVVTMEQLDTDTLCPTSGRLNGEWVYLLDVTDPLNPIQQAAVRKEFDRTRLGVVGEGERFSFYLLAAPASARLDPVVSLCHPGTGAEADWKTENPERLQKRWREGFSAPLDQALDDAFERPASTTSPIMEQIQAASVTGFTGDGWRQKLVIVSDMLQNSERLSMYAGDMSCESFVESGSFDAVRSDLRGVEVEIHYLRRDGSPFTGTARSHIAFWECYFGRLGAHVVRAVRIPG